MNKRWLGEMRGLDAKYFPLKISTVKNELITAMIIKL